ncbi:TolC family protein [Pseudolabrys taiwanensis]|uniref:TolC family protein n=1 Tax=Pseudolabrys taiwanensis TaxID=331696 RepID=A0A345ZWC3_9HYPH|nr:TolC family protein [Pseudolabrys taiwanensis]AXK81220.1 TolC family protein [Pseudolabrys taiwanensis]
MRLWRAALVACMVACVATPSWAQQGAHALTLQQALKRALAANPRLTAAERDLGIAEGRSLQARAIPNPELSAEGENAFGSGPYRGTQSLETTLQLSQLVELGGKRDARIAAGLAGVDAVAWQRRATRLEIMSETAVGFIQVLSEQRRIQILGDHVTALDRLQPLLQRRVEAGASSRPEVLRAQVAADLVRVEREKAKALLSTARRELAMLMGDNAPRFSSVSGNLGVIRRPPPFRTIVDAIENNPQLVRWTAVWAQRNAELLSARLKVVPDVRASVGWRRFRESSDNAMVFGLSMTLPLWDQNQGDILAAHESRDKVQAERAINKLALLSIAGRAYDTATSAVQEIELLRNTVLPNARDAARGLEEGYGQGRYTLLELLDVQAALTEAALREQDALRSFHIAVATIEGLVGRPFAMAQGGRR